jgi:hypothetical protein
VGYTISNREYGEMASKRELLGYSFLIGLALWALITWIPLSITGRVTIIEPSTVIRYTELIMITGILGFSISQCIDWLKRARGGKQ